MTSPNSQKTMLQVSFLLLTAQKSLPPPPSSFRASFPLAKPQKPLSYLSRQTSQSPLCHSTPWKMNETGRGLEEGNPNMKIRTPTFFPQFFYSFVIFWFWNRGSKKFRESVSMSSDDLSKAHNTKEAADAAGASDHSPICSIPPSSTCISRAMAMVSRSYGHRCKG